MDSQGLAAICMGFKSLCILLLLFAWVFKWYCLKPMQILRNPHTHLLKPIHLTTNKQIDLHRMVQNHLKATRLAAKDMPKGPVRKRNSPEPQA